MAHSNTVQRKAIDISGRLGSLYDVSTDNLIDQCFIPASETKYPDQPFICRIFPGDQSNHLINYLDKMDFNDALRLSILLGMTKTSGVSSLINHNQPIHEDIRFLYYSYRSKEEILNFTPGKANQIISLPSSSTLATHMITEILWGFEILCVIPISDHQSSDTVDRLLENISNGLRKSESNFVPTDAEKRQINQLNNVMVYGSETCIGNPKTSLLTILTKIRDWKRSEIYHHPLIYTMYSLRWLYNDDHFPESYYLTDQINSDVVKIMIIMILANKTIKDVEQLFEKVPENFSNSELDQQWTLYKKQFCALLETYQQCRDDLKRTLIAVRQRSCRSVELDKIVSDQRNLSWKIDFDMFYQNVHRWFTKALLIKRLDDNQIRYFKISDIVSNGRTFSTFEEIDTALKSYFTKEKGSITLWYSSDHLKRRQDDKWEQTFKQLVLENQRTAPQTSLVYVDFNQFQKTLEDFTIVQLPLQSKTEHSRDNIKGKKQRTMT
jgi:hypothetical protein